jgi:hypothetical protein
MPKIESACIIPACKEVPAEAYDRIILKTDSHIACRAHAVPMPCRVAKGLECVFPI